MMGRLGGGMLSSDDTPCVFFFFAVQRWASPTEKHDLNYFLGFFPLLYVCMYRKIVLVASLLPAGKKLG